MRENPGVRSYRHYASLLNRGTRRGSVTQSNRWSRRRRRTASPTIDLRNSSIDAAVSPVSSKSASLSGEWALAWTPPDGEVAQPGVGATYRVDAVGPARCATRDGAGNASGMAAEGAVSAICSRRGRSSLSSCRISVMSICILVMSASVVSSSVVSAFAHRLAAGAGGGRIALAYRRLGRAETPLRRIMSRGVFVGPPEPRWDLVPVSPLSETMARSVATGCAWPRSNGDAPCTGATEPHPAVDATGLSRPRTMRSGKDSSPPLTFGRALAGAATIPSLSTARGAPPETKEEDEEKARSMAPRAVALAGRRLFHSGRYNWEIGAKGRATRRGTTDLTRSTKFSTTP